MIELNGRRASPQQKQETFSQYKQRAPRVICFHQTSRRQFWQNEAKKLNLFRAREKTNRGCSAQLAGRIATGLANRACKESSSMISTLGVSGVRWGPPPRLSACGRAATISRGHWQLCRRTLCARRLCPDVGRHLRAVAAHSPSKVYAARGVNTVGVWVFGYGLSAFPV